MFLLGDVCNANTPDVLSEAGTSPSMKMAHTITNECDRICSITREKCVPAEFKKFPDGPHT